jgi:proline iminopeptidase
MAMAPDAADTPKAAQTSNPFAPTTNQMLPVGDGHDIYVETLGHPHGIPAIFLHGGPGSGCQPNHRRLFDPQRFHAVLFDQRGCGLSRPTGSRDANTTAHLIADMEKIRTTMGIERWMVVGGSWGATLALAYAQSHPERVSGLVLRSTFLGTRSELEWAFIDGLRQFHPDLYNDFVSLLAPDERPLPLEAYWRRILNPDPEIHRPAAWAWHDTERVMSEIKPARTRLDWDAIHRNTALPSTPFMEAHYFQNQSFLSPGQLLAGMGALKDIPGIVVQPRYDLLCPVATAHAVVAAWPQAELRIVEGAGHSLQDPGVSEALTNAITEMATRVAAI